MATRGRSGPGRSTPPARRAHGGGPPGARRPSAQPGSRTPGRSRTTAKAPTAGTGPQLTTRAIVLLSVVLLLIASYTSTLHAWWDQRSDIQSSRAEIVMRKAAIVDLKDEKARWNDPAYVKQQARARFGWVFPGEVGYRVIGSDGKVRGDVPTLSAPAVPKTSRWYDKLWGSVKESGKTPKPKKKATPPPDVLKNK